MSDLAIRVEGLGKRYRIGKLQRYKTLRGSLAEAAARPVRAVSSLWNGRASPQRDGASNDGVLWALKDVSFEVKRGEVVGVIKHYSSGKSGCPIP